MIFLSAPAVNDDEVEEKEEEEEEDEELKQYIENIEIDIVEEDEDDENNDEDEDYYTYITTDDDMSMMYIFSHASHADQDLSWSILSNSFFLVGGLCYLILTTWDWLWPTTIQETWFPLYVLLDVIGPTVYLFNSFVDIAWAKSAQQRQQRHSNGYRHRRTRTPDSSGGGSYSYSRAVRESHSNCSSASNSPIPFAMQELNNKNHHHQNDANKRYNSAASGGAVTPSLSPVGQQQQQQQQPQALVPIGLCQQRFFVLKRRIRQADAHRRSFWAAITFGMAATASVMEVMLRYTTTGGATDSSSAAFAADVCANHMYVISALFANTTGGGAGAGGKRTCSLSWRLLWHWNWNHPEYLEDWGDALFLVGSVLDSVLTDFGYKSTFPVFPVITSVLWLLDACLYIRADQIQLERTSHQACTSADVVSLL